MSDLLINTAPGATLALHPLTEAGLGAFLAERSPVIARQAALAGFKARSGQVLVIAGADEGEDLVLFGLGDGAAADGMAFRALPARLPSGDYRLAGLPDSVSLQAAALAWALGGYAFERYRKPRKEPWPRLVVGGLDLAEVSAIAHGCALARDLVNTPANALGPVELERTAREVAERHGATIEVVTGEALLSAGYPAVHAVGRAADPGRAPRMIEISWGAPDAPRLALVGKGVVFDTGGLDLKPRPACG